MHRALANIRCALAVPQELAHTLLEGYVADSSRLYIVGASEQNSHSQKNVCKKVV
jgi:hypothetical protein